MTKKRRRPIHLHVMVSEEEQALIQQRMAEAGIRNMGNGTMPPCGAAVRSAEKALRIGGALILPGSGVCRSPVFTTSGQFVPK